MLTDCCECDRQAARFWGPRPLCTQHLPAAIEADRTAHQCPECGVAVDPQVAWDGDRPCHRCSPPAEPAPPENDKDTDEIGCLADEVALCGLFEGFPDQREALASQLVREAVRASDVRRLREWSERTFTKAKRAGGLANVLSDRERRDEVLEDIRRYHELGVGKKLHPGEGDWAKAADENDWSEADLARRIAASVDSDRVTLDAAAELFHVKPAEARELLAIGRELRGGRTSAGPDTGAGEEEIDHGDRVQQFRKDMAEAAERGVPIDQVIRDRKLRTGP